MVYAKNLRGRSLVKHVNALTVGGACDW